MRRDAGPLMSLRIVADLFVYFGHFGRLPGPNSRSWSSYAPTPTGKKTPR